MEMRQLAGIRVVLVDDDLDALDVVSLVLQLHGAQVRCVASAAEGLRVVREFHPHVLVSDLSMPDEDGYAFIAQVRRLPAEQGGLTPAVAFSAHAYAEDRDRALGAGFQRYLSKPVEPNLVVDAVASLGAAVARSRA